LRSSRGGYDRRDSNSFGSCPGAPCQERLATAGTGWPFGCYRPHLQSGVGNGRGQYACAARCCRLPLAGGGSARLLEEEEMKERRFGWREAAGFLKVAGVVLGSWLLASLVPHVIVAPALKILATTAICLAALSLSLSFRKDWHRSVYDFLVSRPLGMLALAESFTTKEHEVVAVIQKGRVTRLIVKMSWWRDTNHPLHVHEVGMAQPRRLIFWPAEGRVDGSASIGEPVTWQHLKALLNLGIPPEGAPERFRKDLDAAFAVYWRTGGRFASGHDIVRCDSEIPHLVVRDQALVVNRLVKEGGEVVVHVDAFSLRPGIGSYETEYVGLPTWLMYRNQLVFADGWSVARLQRLLDLSYWIWRERYQASQIEQAQQQQQEAAKLYSEIEEDLARF